LWHISNVETWVSTALTDASSCVQSFPDIGWAKGLRRSRLRRRMLRKLLVTHLLCFIVMLLVTSKQQLELPRSLEICKKKFAYFFTLCLFMYILNIHVFSLGGFILLLIKCNICKNSLLCVKKELYNFNFLIY
jgi:hypothetical protein